MKHSRLEKQNIQLLVGKNHWKIAKESEKSK